MAKKTNMLPLAAGAAIVIVLLIAASVLFNPGQSNGSTTTAVTTITGPTTQTVSSITTTIVSNQTTATGPNLASCNGYNYSISQAGFSYVVTCNWRGSAGQAFMNATLWGGSYNNVVLTLVQQNVTTAPFNRTFTADPCATSSTSGIYVPAGNYKLTFMTGSSAACTPAGPASVRISH